MNRLSASDNSVRLRISKYESHTEAYKIIDIIPCNTGIKHVH